MKNEENKEMKESEEMNKLYEVKKCCNNIKLNSNYELIMLCKKCKNEVDCNNYIKRMKKKIVYDNIIMKRNNEKRLCLENLKIVNEFYIMNKKLMIEDEFSRRREMMKIKCDGKESKVFKKMKSEDDKRRLIEKLKKMNVYEYDIKIVKKKKEVNKRSVDMNKYSKCDVVLSI